VKRVSSTNRTAAGTAAFHSLFVISGRVDDTGSAAGCTAVQENFEKQVTKQ